MNTPASPRRSRILTWLRALRLSFYPLSWLGFTLGASIVAPLSELWSSPAYWWGYAVVFLIEALTVFVNDLHDFESDRRNTNHGPFTGGARVLVDGSLTERDLKAGCKVVASGAFVAGLILLGVAPQLPVGTLAGLGVAAVFLGVGYTLPPVKLSHRGLGEVTVAFVHSLLIAQCGALVMGGRFGEPDVLRLGAPLFFAILPSITLAGLPDREADEAAGKRTLAVKFGSRVAVIVAGASAFIACGLGFALSRELPSWVFAAVFLHACLLVGLAFFGGISAERTRIDGVLFTSLAFVLWFSLLPLLTKVKW